MAVAVQDLTPEKSALRRLWERVQGPFLHVPMLSWLVGALVAVLIELSVGNNLARLIGLPKAPVLFGVSLILKEPVLVPAAIVYIVLVYLAPVALVARGTAGWANRTVAKLLDTIPAWVVILIHLLLLYAVLHFWAEVNTYRLLVLRLTMIAIVLTVSLNVVNGYMGEFSCSHPGFMALGAYGASVFSLLFFVDDRIFGAPILPPALGPFLFPLGLIAGGLLASVGALFVAIPSFRTRGDYLAIISLAFTFIIKSVIENLEVVGGPRGLGGQPDWATLPVVFAWTVLAVWIINNFVRSTLGRALNAVRDDETAASAMTVNTRRTKMTAFLFAAFWAGIGGGLLAHVLKYVNPGSFGLQALAEVLAMVYFGGLNSVVGSMVGAVGFNLLSEALRPLEIFKWIIIPVLLILVMIFRPTGLIAFREFDVLKIIRPKHTAEGDTDHALTGS
ncbi:MAG: branched-chain amino acid ABC transporter permease [Chloroflexi bacterium]|nr:MAG: branched-chain amino acid ABC transporter permease [Chloroflexota bacterium]